MSAQNSPEKSPQTSSPVATSSAAPLSLPSSTQHDEASIQNPSTSQKESPTANEASSEEQKTEKAEAAGLDRNDEAESFSGKLQGFTESMSEIHDDLSSLFSPLSQILPKIQELDPKNFTEKKSSGRRLKPIPEEEELDAEPIQGAEALDPDDHEHVVLVELARIVNKTQESSKVITMLGTLCLQLHETYGKPCDGYFVECFIFKEAFNIETSLLRKKNSNSPRKRPEMQMLTFPNSFDVTVCTFEEPIKYLQDHILDWKFDSLHFFAVSKGIPLTYMCVYAIKMLDFSSPPCRVEDSAAFAFFLAIEKNYSYDRLYNNNRIRAADTVQAVIYLLVKSKMCHEAKEEILALIVAAAVFRLQLAIDAIDTEDAESSSGGNKFPHKKIITNFVLDLLEKPRFNILRLITDQDLIKNFKLKFLSLMTAAERPTHLYKMAELRAMTKHHQEDSALTMEAYLGFALSSPLIRHPVRSAIWWMRTFLESNRTAMVDGVEIFQKSAIQELYHYIFLFVYPFWIILRQQVYAWSDTEPEEPKDDPVLEGILQVLYCWKKVLTGEIKIADL